MIKDILAERGKTHGKFEDVAQTYKAFSHVISINKKQALTPGQSLALDVICQKMARILCGDANYKDHWVDIAGYATLGGGL